MSAALPIHDAPRRMWPRLLWLWVAFWLLLLLIGEQEYLRQGGRRTWLPLIDYGTAAVFATLLAAIQLRRGRRFAALLDQPWRWFPRMWAWLPLQLVLYLATVYGLRWWLYGLAGIPFQVRDWSATLANEGTRFLLNYALLGGIQFGLHSYFAWSDERLRAEQQARLAQQAQLMQLTQQLEPHFLFNALNTVSSLIHVDPDLADTLITRLATLLRAATDASQRPCQSLADELVLLRAYADIMTQRFADRVVIEWDIADDVARCMVPTLALQPLLENCFRHGVERRTRLTRIKVAALRFDGALRVDVENDGELDMHSTRQGVGLGNLRRRLAALYGDRASLTLRQRDDDRVIAEVVMPCEC